MPLPNQIVKVHQREAEMARVTGLYLEQHCLLYVAFCHIIKQHVSRKNNAKLTQSHYFRGTKARSLSGARLAVIPLKREGEWDA